MLRIICNEEKSSELNNTTRPKIAPKFRRHFFLIPLTDSQVNQSLKAKREEEELDEGKGVDLQDPNKSSLLAERTGRSVQLDFHSVRLLKYRKMSTTHFLSTEKQALIHQLKEELDYKKLSRNHDWIENVSYRSLENTNTCKSYFQVWQLMSKMYQLLQEKKTVTQRELYYMTMDSWADQDQCNLRIVETCLMLNCPRECVGVVASAKGYLYGPVKIQLKASVIDVLSLSSPGMNIPGSLVTHSMDEIKVCSDARFILVVEKDGVYRRLIEDGLCKTLPCIVITACGFPDVATRYMVYTLWKKLNIPVYCLVDYNPYGFHIFLTYTVGTPSELNPATYQYTVNEMKWLGVHSEDISEYNLVTSELHDKDEQVIHRLLQYEYVNKYRNGVYKKQLQFMLHKRKICEIQAFNNLGYQTLTKTVVQKVIRRQHL